MKGYTGKILHVDLSTGSITIGEPEEKFYRMYLGGRGFIAYFLLKHTKPGLDAFSPDNPLIFANGALTGFPIAGNPRNAVGCKSPLTDSFGEAEAGGFFNADMKRAGFDAAIITGKAAKPVYLFLKDGQAEIRDASALWGLEVAQTQDAIRAELGDQRVHGAYIGVGGEKLCRFAAIINDCKHAAARSGVGAVMGSKNLKAVVARGNTTPEAADPEKIREIGKWIVDNPQMYKGMSQVGTGGGMAGTAKTGNIPTRNFQDGYFEGIEKISADTLRETIGKGMEGCWACAVRCKKVVDADSAWGHIDAIYGGPEYETLGMLGADCGVSDLSAVCKAHDLCNRYGLDTISTGGTIAFAMECYEKGLITKVDTGGMDLSFGNADALVRLTEMIAKREGIGDLLAEGSLRAAKKIGKGAEKFVMAVKGQEIPAHEPRLKQALGIGYAVNPSGADHACSVHDAGYTTEAGVAGLKNLGIFAPLPSTELSPAKTELAFKVGLGRHANNCVIMCQFVPYGNQRTLDLINAATGWNMDFYELMEISERVVTMARLYNAREGFTAAEDVLPERFGSRQHGGSLDAVVEPQKFDEARKLYYGMFGWDDNGVPTKATLVKHGLAWAEDALPR